MDWGACQQADSRGLRLPPNSLAGHNQAAIDAFGKAIEKNYRESRVFNNMAVAYANLGHYDDATDAFRKAGGEAHAYNNMGCIYLEKGNYPEAVRCFEKAIALEPSFYAKASDNLKKANSPYAPLVSIIKSRATPACVAA